MRTPRGVGFHARMSSGERVRLTLEIERGSDPIVGRVRDLCGRSVEFSGWLGLASALEGALTVERGDPSSPPAGPERHPQLP